MLLTLERTLCEYQPSYITESVSRESACKKLVAEFREALSAALSAIKKFRDQL
jgi:hypothetical protein